MRVCVCFPQSVLCLGGEAEEVVVEVVEDEGSEDMDGEGVSISALLDVVCHRENQTSSDSPFQPNPRNREGLKEVRIISMVQFPQIIVASSKLATLLVAMEL